LGLGCRAYGRRHILGARVCCVSSRVEGFRVSEFQGSGFRVEGSQFGFWDWGLGFGVWGLGFGVWGLGFGVWGLGLSV